MLFGAMSKEVESNPALATDAGQAQDDGGISSSSSSNNNSVHIQPITPTIEGTVEEEKSHKVQSTEDKAGVEAEKSIESKQDESNATNLVEKSQVTEQKNDDSNPQKEVSSVESSEKKPQSGLGDDQTTSTAPHTINPQESQNDTQEDLPALPISNDVPVSQSSPKKLEEPIQQDDDAAAEKVESTNAPSDENTTTSAKDISTTHNVERELPAPPTPIKAEKSLPSTMRHDDEVADVARAFGVHANVSEKTSSTEHTTTPSDTTVQPTVPGPSTSSGKTGGLRIGKGPPPTTQASEERPFDFNRFLDQMRHRSAGPVGEYVRSFIKGFTKKPYRVSDQTKLILDFLDFIALEMRKCDVWASLPQNEFENAMEAMEKLIMNRLYNYTFSPAIKREGKWSVQTDDLERDRVLKQRIRLFGWIDESHLDVPTGDHSKGFVDFAIQELLKINHYKAPRDKVICILNCCKVIFGLIRHLSTQENADTFVPILIFVVLRANPDNLISNVEYISRFRNPERLSSESGYYLSSLMGAIAFVETMDYTSLSNITQQEFEANVEAAILSISAQADSLDQLSPARLEGLTASSSSSSSGGAGLGSEKDTMRTIIGGTGSGAESSTLGSAQMTPQGSVSSNEDAGGRSIPAGAATLAKDTRAFIQRTGEAARVGIGASFGGGMSALGRLFQDGLDGPRTPLGTSPGAGTANLAGYSTPENATPGGGSGGSQAAAGQSGTATPSGGGVSGTGSARARMWNLFGVDEDQRDQLAIRTTKEGGGSGGGGRSISGSSFNFGSWGRNMRVDADSEPPTPQSEELQQGRFATLGGAASGGGATPSQPPLSERLARSFEQRTPHTPAQQPRQPIRRESTDPYMIDDDGQGVRTPTDDGSEDGDERVTRGHLQVGGSGPGAGAGAGRGRPSDLSNLLPNFLSDVGLVRSSTDQPRQQSNQQGGAPLDDEQAAQAAAQIDRAHLDAGVDTLKSIFPDTESSVCRLVLEGCDGNVQAAIDKLLEMT